MKELLGYATTNDDTSVHVIDLVYEAFVLIGDRSDKRDGILALNVAKVRCFLYNLSLLLLMPVLRAGDLKHRVEGTTLPAASPCTGASFTHSFGSSVLGERARVYATGKVPTHS